MKLSRVLCCAGLIVLATGLGWSSEAVMLVDFTKPGHGWKGNPRTRPAAEGQGFCVELTGEDDPWLEGPSVAVPGADDAQRLALELDAVCGRSGDVQVFFAAEGKPFTAEQSAWLRSPDAVGGAYRGVIPLFGQRMRFRLDPPGSEGRVCLRALRARPLMPLATFACERPVRVALPSAPLRVESGAVEVAHDPARWNAFVCSVKGRAFAESNPAETLAYVVGRQVVSVPLAAAAVAVERHADGFTVSARVRDAGGAEWVLTRRFSPCRDGVRIDGSLAVDQPREAVHLPWVTLFAGCGSFGDRKGQALLPGVEYLENEPSSNEKEIAGEAANRRLVAPYKVCYPMMALTADGRWFSLVWQTGKLAASPLFDSPDRVFYSGGHVMGVWSPAVGEARFESEFSVYRSVKLAAGHTYAYSATVSGGDGAAITEAVGAYVARAGLPQVPVFEGGFDAAVRLLAAGWLDSAARQELTWRHAVWGDHFPPVPYAEDVPAYLLWLAAQTTDRTLKTRLADTAREVIANLPPGCYGVGGISHVKRPVGALLYGHLEGLVRQAGPRAVRMAASMPEGRMRYAPQSGKPDYAATLGSDHCNGFTAMTAEEMLAQASLSGDEAAITAALAVLDKITSNYAGQVPRGAQPWEMPLHTPDIVAAGRLVRAYVLGYLLSGKNAYLEQARYWAWTGVTMLYLAPPTEGPVGLYATIGVIGATNWKAPNWIGQPVQWCGLVYRSALEDLARVDRVQPELWRTLAHGMTVAGLQMCFPLDDAERRCGLLPDYFLLQPQRGDGPAINPGTLQAHLAEAYGKVPFYSATRLASGSLVHVPGEARPVDVRDGTTALTITAWPESDYRVLMTRVGRPPQRVLWNGRPVGSRYLAEARVLWVSVSGSGRLDVVDAP